MSENGAVGRVVRCGYWREEDARVVVDAWRDSGVSLAQFCRSNGIAAARVSRWAARLAGDGQVRFHPVRLTDGGDRAAPRGLEIELPGGAIVRLPTGFALDDLRRILIALEPAAGC